jgi:hypothetical protein
VTVRPTPTHLESGRVPSARRASFKEKTVHYKNGREAKNGDKVVLQRYDGSLVTGILFDATPGNDCCNGKLAVISGGEPCPNLKDCLHLDDVKDLLKAADPDLPH